MKISTDGGGAAPAWLYAIGIVLLWLLALNLAAWISGWRSLARSYATDAPTTGQAFSYQSGRLGYSNYGSCLHFVSGPAGLALSVLFAFRPGHRPLFVPWSDVSARFYEGWVLRYAEFCFAKHPETRLRVFRGLGEKLLAAGGNVVRPAETH
jgi:hypothetical protein